MHGRLIARALPVVFIQINKCHHVPKRKDCFQYEDCLYTKMYYNSALYSGTKWTQHQLWDRQLCFFFKSSCASCVCCFDQACYIYSGLHGGETLRRLRVVVCLNCQMLAIDWVSIFKCSVWVLLHRSSSAYAGQTHIVFVPYFRKTPQVNVFLGYARRTWFCS